jgi:hypothetical protein
MDRQSCRRRRPALSCIECRRRKVKCDRTDPCAHCVAAGSQCTYKIYSDPRVIRHPRQQGSSLGSVSSPSMSLASPLGHSQQLNGSRPVAGYDVRSEAQIAYATKTQNGFPNTVGLNDVQPTNQTPDEGPDFQDLLRRIQKLEESSAPAPVQGLAETSRSILVGQAGLQGSEIMLKKTRIANWSDWMGTAPEVRFLSDSSFHQSIN